MKVVNIHEAKAHLSRLIERAASGEPFIIAKAGKPMVRVAAVAEDGNQSRRLASWLARSRFPTTSIG